MVPSKVGDELRRRRMGLRLTQAQIGEAISRTRSYVSAIENGVGWDPDAEQLALWAKMLGWEPDYILRRLGRVAGEATEPMIVSPALLAAIRLAVAEGVRQGVADALRSLDADSAAPPGGGGASGLSRRERLV